MYAMFYKTSLTDDKLRECFDRIASNGRFEQTFYDGKTEKDAGVFIHDMRNPFVHFWLMADVNENGSKEAGFIWVTALERGGADGGTANIHFCMFDGVHPLLQFRLCRFGVSRILRLMDDEGKYIIQTLFGITPVRNKQACRWVRNVGFTELCILPGVAYMADTRKNEDAMLTYATRETIKEEWGISL